MSSTPESQPCHEYLVKQCAGNLFTADDLLAVLLPLMEQTHKTHEAGFVAPLDGLNKLWVNYRHIYFEDHDRVEAKCNLLEVNKLQVEVSSSFRIVGEANETLNMTDGTLEREELVLDENADEVYKLIYLPAFRSWEHALGHHDALTDIYSLGLILASFALGLDLGDKAQLKYFIENRQNLFVINNSLNPVVASMIVGMTELNRRDRVQDLELIIKRFKNYREQEVDKDIDYADYAGFNEASVDGKREIIQSYLCKRLFEISKRNRLLYYKEALSHLNLTQASVPIILDYKNIRPEQLFLWHGDLVKRLFSRKGLDLNLYLRFEDTPYLPGILDKIRLQANRDIKEYGFAQLRLVVVFLNWHNLKEEKETRIQSPLLLLPVKITKKKGITDAYILNAESTLAEVNPVLKHQLEELYGLDLPDSIDLADADLNQFYELLQKKIHNSENAVELQKDDKPKIELIHAKAKQRLNTYRKRARFSGKGVRFMGDLDYSYQADNFQPLGLQIFSRKVRPPASPFANLLDERPAPRLPQINGEKVNELEATPIMEKEREMYRVKENESNPYVWSFDMCSLTLANFNYRKMSLVQDYKSFLEDELENPAFDELFSLNPKPQTKQEHRALDFNQSYFIVPSDRSQINAVLQAREGFSYIIQGPPGTGKSQTITNLIADYAARGKRVLFVCEKRAAIDVVYHRLHQAGLEELSCLIHDSQTDKKAFVMDVKKTYESFIANEEDESLEEERTKVARDLSESLELLDHFVQSISSATDGKTPINEVINHILSLSKASIDLSEKDIEKLPVYDFWLAEETKIQQLLVALKEYNYPQVWKQFPYRFLNSTLSHEVKPLNVIAELTESLSSYFKELQELNCLKPEFYELCHDLSELETLLKFCHDSQVFVERNLLGLLDGNSHISRSLRSMFKDYEKAEDDYNEAQEKTVNWQNKLELRDTETALSQAINYDVGVFRYFMPSFWRLRKVMKGAYNFSAHAIEPRWVDILRDLVEEHKCLKSLNKTKEKIAADFGFEDIELTDTRLKELRAQMTGQLKAWKSFFCTSEKATEFMLKAAELYDQFDKFKSELTKLFYTIEDQPCLELEKWIQKASECDHDDLYILGEFSKQDVEVQVCLQNFDLNYDQLTRAIAEKYFDDHCRQDKKFDRFTYKKLSSLRESFAKKFKKWQSLNAKFIIQQVTKRFKEHYLISETPQSQLTNDEEKEFRSLYRAGRKELEHEFGKSMRYKSIRSLAAEETSIVLRDLKPIWLMSPLSVSDTLPLKIDEFDVVIFDEASQIQLEESIPALYRSPQIIVVGDEKQLPPTNFFASSSSNDEQSVFIEEAGESYEYDLNADSFLTQSARTLPSTMLIWHYRSRYEKLISFSNEAFYEGRLLTIPDRSVETAVLPEIIVNEPATEIDLKTSLFNRSIGFHYLTNGCYERRKNKAEAQYIAQLVRQILNDGSGLSIGIVAFSEAQQAEIEEALNRLGLEDKTFRAKLEAEMDREEDEQFVGLFVKNLENVQGDERDIIILSVCYGYDRDGKMRMNFGPINKSGGEKRLNVIFSRSKKHMVVVSSIKGSAITNTYNDGANCLKNYLDYSEAVSLGDEKQVEMVLNRLYHSRSNDSDHQRINRAAQQLAEALQARGWHVDQQVGQSRFRCDLAIRRSHENKYALAILFDQYSRHQDTLEDFLLKPIVLDAFDWKYEFILTKDWYEDSQSIIERIELKISNQK